MMKKRYLFVLLMTFLFVLAGCKKKPKQTELEKFINNIDASEEVLTGYEEKDKILDGEIEIYTKELSFKVERGEEVKTEVHQSEQRLNSNIQSTDLLVTTEYSYITIGNKKYELTNGGKEVAYTIPTYYLTFMLSEEDLDDGYTLVSEGDTNILTSKIKEDRIKEFFLNKSNLSVQDLHIVIEVKNDKLVKMQANYTTANGFQAYIEFTYSYENVEIVYNA